MSWPDLWILEPAQRSYATAAAWAKRADVLFPRALGNYGVGLKVARASIDLRRRPTGSS